MGTLNPVRGRRDLPLGRTRTPGLLCDAIEEPRRPGHRLDRLQDDGLAGAGSRRCPLPGGTPRAISPTGSRRPVRSRQLSSSSPSGTEPLSTGHRTSSKPPASNPLRAGTGTRVARAGRGQTSFLVISARPDSRRPAGTGPAGTPVGPALPCPPGPGTRRPAGRRDRCGRDGRVGSVGRASGPARTQPARIPGCPTPSIPAIVRPVCLSRG